MGDDPLEKLETDWKEELQRINDGQSVLEIDKLNLKIFVDSYLKEQFLWERYYDDLFDAFRGKKGEERIVWFPDGIIKVILDYIFTREEINWTLYICGIDYGLGNTLQKYVEKRLKMRKDKVWKRPRQYEIVFR